MARHSNENFDRADFEQDGNAIGLTRAFSPIDDADLYDGPVSTDPFETGVFRPVETPEAPEGAAALTDDDLVRPAGRARHARHAKAADPEPLVSPEGEVLEPLCAPTAFEDKTCALPGDEVPAYLHKSRRMRRVLWGVVIVLLVLLVAGGVLVWQLLGVAQTTASQQAQTVAQDTTAINADEETKDASTATAKKTTVPVLTGLLGLSLDESIEQLQHGAQVSTTSEVNEEGNPIKSQVRIVLTSEPADSRSGTPTVYLGLNEEGKVVQAGYSAATSSLGYGSLSFADAVRNEHVVEKTLNEAGVGVMEGTAQLPEDKASYSTYASDGTTLTKEYCSFAGEAGANGASHAWSAVLSYDYSMANATGNLANTIRTIFVYVNA